MPVGQLSFPNSVPVSVWPPDFRSVSLGTNRSISNWENLQVCMDSVSDESQLCLFSQPMGEKSKKTAILDFLPLNRAFLSRYLLTLPLSGRWNGYNSSNKANRDLWAPAAMGRVPKVLYGNNT